MRIRDDVHVYLVPMSGGAREMVLPDPDGYTVYMNEAMSVREMQDVYGHVVRHIDAGHLDYGNRMTVQEMEADAHLE